MQLGHQKYNKKTARVSRKEEEKIKEKKIKSREDSVADVSLDEIQMNLEINDITTPISL